MTVVPHVAAMAALAETHVRQKMCAPAYPGGSPEPGLGFTGGEDAVRAILGYLIEHADDLALACQEDCFLIPLRRLLGGAR